MNTKKIFMMIQSLILLLVIVFPKVLLAQPMLEYQNRGNRFEGVKPKPVSGYDVELISALIDYEEKEAKPLPDELKIRFYLAKQVDVRLTVRELDNRLFYWMDRVKSPRAWGPGFDNKFQWSTGTVLQQLDRNMDLYKLGALVRLGKSGPSSDEEIAPVILYHSHAPKTVTGYNFTLKTASDARISLSISKDNQNDDDSKPIWKQFFRRKIGGRPFTVRWDASKAEKGSYKLVVSGFFLDSNDQLLQKIRFHHQPTVHSQ